MAKAEPSTSAGCEERPDITLFRPSSFLSPEKTSRMEGIGRLPRTKDENIGFDGYIGTWILRIYRIYRRYIDGYFYINIDN